MVQHDHEISVAIVGDSSNWNQNHTTREDIPAEIRKMIGECDVFCFNLEGPIVNENIKPKGFVKSALIKQFLKRIGKLQPIVTNTENVLEALTLANINVACLANNHMLDAGEEGIAYTLQTLKEHNFQSLGAGSNQQEASSPLIVEVKGKKIGFLNYNFIGWKKFGIFVDPFAARHDKAGVNHGNQHKVIQDIASFQNAVDYLIVILHAGRKLQKTLSPSENRFLKSLNADCIVVHHPHISQTICLNNTFSVGDFLFFSPKGLSNFRESTFLRINLGCNAKEYKLNIVDGLPCLVK